MADSLPRYTFQWNYKTSKNLILEEGGFLDRIQGDAIIAQKNMSNYCAISTDNKNRQVFVVGCPMVGDKINNQETSNYLACCTDLTNEVKNLNGEFLVISYEPSSEMVDVYTDRFASYPFYWACSPSEFLGSYLYVDIAKKCSSWPNFQLCPEKAYEFFILQRLMGDTTHDTVTNFLPAATHLSVGPSGKTKLDTYWSRYPREISQKNIGNLVDEFVDLFSKSVSMRMQETDKKYGVFLSGGHDSRIVAAYADKPASCYTLGFTDNNEVECARKIASSIGQKHEYWELDDAYFYKTLDQSSEISGGMYALDHALFLPVLDSFQPSSEIYLHGHGLDYMYHGMYLHAKPYKLMGRDTFIKRLIPFPQDISQHFIQSISFKLKYDMLDKLVVQSQQEHYSKSLYKTVKNLENTFKDKGLDNNDVWENLIFHTPSRHYTFTNVLSKRAWGEVRTPSFDNKLYEFFLSLPIQHRLHADMLRGAMRKHPSNIDHIPSGNYGIPAGWNPYAKTAQLVYRKVVRDLTKLRRFYPPTSVDRTWPERDEYMKTHPKYWDQAVSPLFDAGFKDFLNFIDWKKLENDPKSILNEFHGASFMVSLLTYYLFYKKIYN